MYMRIFMTTFWLIFVAELGDKTQLATMLMAVKTNSMGSVFLGSAAALVLSSLLGVLAGSVVTRFVPANYIQTAAGIGFVIIGLLLITGRI